MNRRRSKTQPCEDGRHKYPICVVVIKLQKRVKAKTATLLIKVKAHRGCPLNEEEDIRVEMGRMKEEQEKTWSEPTNRTIYQWSETSKTKTGTLTTKQSEWRKGSGKMAQGTHHTNTKRRHL